jgi:hypothetical protein
MASPEITVLSALPFATAEKATQTFQLPRELVAFLKTEAARRGLDLTAYVTRILDGFRTYYGRPAAVVALLEEDRGQHPQGSQGIQGVAGPCSARTAQRIGSRR